MRMYIVCVVYVRVCPCVYVCMLYVCVCSAHGALGVIVVTFLIRIASLQMMTEESQLSLVTECGFIKLQELVREKA